MKVNSRNKKVPFRSSIKKAKRKLETNCCSAPKCPYCGSSNTTDNGDSWYCYSCNSRFEYDC